MQINIAFGKVVKIFEKFTCIAVSTYGRALIVSEANRTIPFRIIFWCGAVEISLALLVLPDTADYTFSGIATLFATLNSCVSFNLSCQPSLLVSASK